MSKEPMSSIPCASPSWVSPSDPGPARGRWPSEGARIPADSLPGIRKAWHQAKLDLQDDPEIRAAVNGALGVGKLLTASALWFLSRPDEERRAIAAWGLRACDQLRGSDRAIDLRRMAPEDFRALGAADRAKGREPAPPARRIRTRRRRSRPGSRGAGERPLLALMERRAGEPGGLPDPIPRERPIPIDLNHRVDTEGLTLRPPPPPGLM
jgi:hypothetical protein